MKFNELNTTRFGSKIRRLRELQNLTQDYVAQKLEMSTTGYGKIERGESDLSLYKMGKIAEIIGFTIEEIIQFDDDILLSKVQLNQTDLTQQDKISHQITLLKQMANLLREENAFLKKIILNWQNSPSDL